MTGFRLDVTKMLRKVSTARSRIRAQAFKPELNDFLTRSLADAANMTPVRDYSLIRRNQSNQYRARVNCIPSAHTLVNPSLRVNTKGEHWLFSNGQWYLANQWHLQPPQWSAYQTLLNERDRRLKTTRPTFIAERAQARFLYRLSWSQVADSLGLRIPTPANVRGAHSRHNPPKAPPRGYGVWHGGNRVMSASIRNPFLEEPSDYKQWSGKEILARAMAKNRPRFNQGVRARLSTTLKAIR